MASAGAAFALGIILILLALYLGLGPLASNRDGSAQLGTPMTYSLPSWYEFPGGVTVQVSWSEGRLFTYVGVGTCEDANCSQVNTVVANGTGSQGSETFTALPGATYVIFTDAGVQLQVQSDYSVAYTLLIVILLVLGVGSLGYGFVVGWSHSDLKRI